MSSSIENTLTRRKDHKGGKVLSLGILWVALVLVAILALVQLASLFFNKEEAKKYDKDVVAVTVVTSGDKLQPMSAKIVASSSSSMISSHKTIKASHYDDVWAKLELLAPATASDEERLRTIASFLASLNYRMTAKGGEIVSISDGNPISPSTLTCYLNGYIPDKPHIKPNCPAY